MRRFFPLTVVVVLVLNAGLLSGMLFKSSEDLSSPVKMKLQNGDLVVRNGRGVVSSWFRNMSLSDQHYTHAGLINIKDDKIYVIHCYQESSSHGLWKETFSDFTNGKVCESFAVYHYDLNNDQRKKLTNIIASDLNSGVEFDDAFELNNGKTKYCTEWIYDCVTKATDDTSYLTKTYLKDFAYIAPDNLYLNSHAKNTLHYSYK